MPNRRNRARRRRGNAGALLYALIILLAAVAAVLALMLVKSDPLSYRRSGDLPYSFTGDLNFAEADDATSAPLVLGSSAAPEPAQSVMPNDAPAPTGVPEADEAGTDPAAPSEDAAAESADSERLIPAPAEGDYFLPVFDRALRTADDRAMIAVTIDGCDDADKMTQILNIAERYDAKLTLFPTGDALMTLASGFRICVNTLDYEIENCTYDKDKKDYALSTGELALQIWRQSIATSYAMGRDYQQHFYRPLTQGSAGDQRTHYFIRKLGFLGVASYTYSYKGHDLQYLVDSLENGNIYQFDMSDESMALFEVFLNEANRKGYKLVTMNELFGLEPNEIGGALTIDQQTLPDTNDYVPTYYDLKLNCRANAVYALQSRLMGLGYLTAESGKTLTADGIYGADTSVAVSKFQANVGIIATGDADAETQRRLFAQDAPMADAQSN